jgi:metal-dependent amidase/aminoacylase/carboxypeptidase family protein
MGAEDFAFYLEKVPGALLRLGLGEDWAPLHSPGFDFNDDALEPGIRALVGLAVDVCSR